MKKSSSAIRDARGDKAFYITVDVILAILCIVILYPMIYVVSSSFSSSKAVLSGKVVLWPVDPSLEGYEAVLSNPNIMTGFRNSILYTLIGTTCNVFFTMMCAYPLAEPGLPHKGKIMFLFTFTIYFYGGMIPNYLLMRDLGLINNPLVMILPGLMTVYNMIIARTSLQALPHDLHEAADIDGCSDVKFFFAIVLPLSKAIMAVQALYYAVGHWNSYFNAFIYLNNRDFYPLSLFLREILISNQMSEAMDIDPLQMERKQGLAELLKYSLIVISMVPILCVYPFVQKYFVKGVMIGSLKG